VSQTIAGLPDMYPGTEVRVVSMDLITIYASASVENNELVLKGRFTPNAEVRLLILQPDANAQETVEALGNKALHARISPEGDDILLQFAELDGPLSFKQWLGDERHINLELNPSDDE
jgi:hypothetical protein